VDRFPSVSFPVASDREVLRELQALVSQLSPRGPIDIPYLRTNIETTSLMTLALDPRDIKSFWYQRETENLFTINLFLRDSVIGGTPNSLIYVRIPEGRLAVGSDIVAGHGGDGGATFFALRVETVANDNRILVRRENLGNWTAGAVFIGFQIKVRLLPVTQ
jgi:hypothetical protein